jgi:hypothetical protein
LKKNKLYSYGTVFGKVWPYWLGGILLGIINIFSLAFTGKPLRITSGFLYWAVGIYEFFGGKVADWYYFQDVYHKPVLQKSFFINDTSLLVIGAVTGALLSVFLASSFKVRKIKNPKQLIFALIGGIIMGYGTRIAMGCNIGAFLSGISSFSAHGWVFGLFMLVGVWLGVQIINKYQI